MVGGVDNVGLDYLINFVVNLDPNDASNKGIIHWAEWSPSTPNMLTFVQQPLGGLLGLTFTLDTYRLAAMCVVTFFLYLRSLTL